MCISFEFFIFLLCALYNEPVRLDTTLDDSTEPVQSWGALGLTARVGVGIPSDMSDCRVYKISSIKLTTD